MATQQTFDTFEGPQTTASGECNTLIAKLATTDSQNCLEAVRGADVVGAYTTDGRELVYSNGFRTVRGRKARRYLETDLESTDTTVRLVSQTAIQHVA